MRSELFPILSNTKSSSSGRGGSYYSNPCARKAWLNEQFGDGESSFEAQTGTLIHKLDELYTTDALKNYIIPVIDTFDEDSPIHEALRVFSVYIQRFPWNEFETLSAERLLPSTDAEKEIITKTFGFSPLTGRIDRVIRASEQQVETARRRRKISLVPGKKYILDTKTSSKKDSNAQLKYELSVQFPTYAMMLNALEPNDPVEGIIVNRIVRHKKLTDESFQTYIVSAPTEMTQQAVRAQLLRDFERLQKGEPNLHECDAWGGCIHFKTGNCNRI